MAECGFCQQRDKSVDSALICEGCCDKVAAWGAMWDLLGDLWSNGEPNWATIFSHPAAKLHLYGKTEPRPGRKMGHLTLIGEPGESARDVSALATSLRAGI